MGNQFAVRQRHFDVRRVARSKVEVAKRNRTGGAIGPYRVNVGIEDGHRHAHVRWMRGNAVLADAQHGVAAIEAVERIAAGSRLSAVARRMNISEIGAARPLQDVAGDRRHVADLRGGARQDRFRQHREAIAHDRVPRQLTVGDGRADDDRVIRHVDARHAEMPNIHNGVWRQHVDLHQIDERRATSQKHRARASGHGARRIRRARQPFKGEGVHDALRSLRLRASRFSDKHLPHGGHDVRIGGTAAQIAAHPLADLVVCQCRGC